MPPPEMKGEVKMKKQIMKIQTHGVCITIEKHSEDLYNPYRVYRHWWDMGDHRRCVAKYADLRSALLWVADVREFQGERISLCNPWN